MDSNLADQATANGVAPSASPSDPAIEASSPDSGDINGAGQPASLSGDKPQGEQGEAASSPQAESAEASKVQKEPEPENFWVEMRNILVLSIALALGIRHFVAEARYIPSESMLPTLEVNDRLIVEKMSYRFREPTRGDVVVFRPTDTIKAENPTFNDAL
ncbi:MAG: signal peptidase I, partial [Cyanobacteria bacterium P01_A01_bin.135]